MLVPPLKPQYYRHICMLKKTASCTIFLLVRRILDRTTTPEARLYIPKNIPVTCLVIISERIRAVVPSGCI